MEWNVVKMESSVIICLPYMTNSEKRYINERFQNRETKYRYEKYETKLSFNVLKSNESDSVGQPPLIWTSLL